MKWEYNRHANDLLTLLSWNFSILLPQAKCCLSVRCSFIFIWKSLLQQFIRYILAVSVEPVSLCASVRSAPIEPVEKPALCSGLPTDGMQWRIKINRKFVYYFALIDCDYRLLRSFAVDCVQSDLGRSTCMIIAILTPRHKLPSFRVVFRSFVLSFRTNYHKRRLTERRRVPSNEMLCSKCETNSCGCIVSAVFTAVKLPSDLK